MDPGAALHAVVHGRVQGVGYRFFVVAKANDRGLCGWVKNLEGGSVKVRAEGPREHLEALLADLRQGPRMAFVERVDVQWLDGGATSGSGSFEIRY